ncbi:MAG TPA: glycosyltransferase family 39 protein [Xanthomonadales bacterium]|nr:glycosyltransferase family 39 protein [Xanthomonadales bacterium]
MSKSTFFVLALILTGAFLRFYNLNWGAPFYFHPDERNVIDLVLKSSLTNPESLLKGTFAYGNFPVILTLLLKPLLLPFFQIYNLTDPFAQTAVTLRFVSAIFSVLTLYVIYLCGKFWSQKVALLALFLAVFSTGLIQQAHFGTYDGFGAFCTITIFYFLLKFLKTKVVINYYFAFLFIAFGAAAKINLLVLAIFPIIILFTGFKKHKNRFMQIFKHSALGVILLISSTILLSPNYLTPEFIKALLYERGLVAGTTPVFYTQSFYDTTPIVFQFIHILPFLINPLLTIILIPAFLYVFYKGVKTKNLSFLILNSFFLILFLPQAFLHAKWTRYMVPTLPFIYLIVAFALERFYSSSEQSESRSSNSAIQQFSNLFGSRQARTVLTAVILLINIIFAVSYLITAFVRSDTRIEASNFAQSSIPPAATTLTEPYDLGIMPFNSYISSITPFNFYDLDLGNNEMEEELRTKLEQADYIILPSQRLLRSRLSNPKKFPKGHAFYTRLSNETLGFQKIYETPCDIFCKITYLGRPVFGFEETASVFDRPTVLIFKKIQ